MKVILCLLFLISACKAPVVNDINPIDRYLTPQSKDFDKEKEEFLLLINTFRQNAGLLAFNHSEYINEVALSHAENMAQGKVSYGHSGTFERCESVRKEFFSEGSCAEIIARGGMSAQKIFKSWIETEAKNEILNPSYTETGVGIARNSEGKYFWVQIFLEGP